MRRILKKEKNMTGYLSLEASFVVPLVFMLFILSIYFTFFLYNHLVVNQSCYIAALRGSRLKNSADKVVEAYTGDELCKLLDEQIYQYSADPVYGHPDGSFFAPGKVFWIVSDEYRDRRYGYCSLYVCHFRNE